MRPRALVLLCSLALAASAEEPNPLTLCLAPAADGSPVYPLQAVPATHQEVVIAFRLRPGESFQSVSNVWTAVDVGEAAPPNIEMGRGEVRLGASTSGHFRFTLPRDFPVGKYRLDALGDGKPWASLEFTVVPGAAPAPLAKPSDLLPLEPGTAWTYSWLLEPGPAAKKLTVAGVEKGEDGRYRSTTTLSVAAKEDGLARIEMRRGDTLVSEEWWSLTEAGLSVTQARRGDRTTAYEPPLPMIALPLRSVHRWAVSPKGMPAMECRMWGPLPVRTPAGETPGWVVWIRTASGPEVTTIERHFAPGVGVVREVHVAAVGPSLLTRVETGLLPKQ